MKKILLTLLFLGLFIQKSFECDQKILELIFILDSSGSIGPDDFQKAKNALIKVVDDLQVNPGGVRVGLINYSDIVRTEIDMNDDSIQHKENLTQIIRNIPYIESYTATGEALQSAQTLFKRSTGKYISKVAIVFTDGQSNGQVDPIPVATSLRETDRVSIISVGIGPFKNKAELFAMAEKPENEYYLDIPSYNAITTEIENLIGIFCKAKAYVGLDEKAKIKNDLNEKRYFQIDLSKMSVSENQYANVEVEYLEGDVDLSISWLLQNGRTVQEKNFKKTKNSNRNVFDYFFQVPSTNPLRMYLTFKGLESINIYEFKASIL